VEFALKLLLSDLALLFFGKGMVRRGLGLGLAASGLATGWGWLRLIRRRGLGLEFGGYG
jgi:hypothetical protein